MKAKTIKSVLRRKIDDWANSITDETVRRLVLENTIVTGGSIASMLLKEQVNDFDVYFCNKATVLAVANYYVDQFKKNPPTKFKNDPEKLAQIRVDCDAETGRIKVIVKSAGIASEEGAEDYQYFESADPEGTEAFDYVEQVMGAVEQPEGDDKPRYRPVFMTSNAITLSDKVQIVLRFYGEPDEIHKNYDFIHCTNYWTSNDGKLTLRQEALEALLARELRYVGSLYSLCSVIRTRKFIKRDWTINAGQYLKMCMQISKLDLTNLATLEDQMIGVDAAYFNEVVHKLREKDATSVDSAYLIEIIDRIF